MIRGPRLGVDVGTVRVGIAISDPDGILATPLVTLARDRSARAGAGPATRSAAEPGSVVGAGAPAVPGSAAGAGALAVPADVAEIARLVRDHEVVQVVVGLPVALSGNEGLAAAAARDYADVLARQVDPVPVQLADERMSTVIATRRLSERGVRRRRQRAVVDQAAAVEILQGWLDARRS